jgi:hypothetical protein
MIERKIERMLAEVGCFPHKSYQELFPLIKVKVQIRAVKPVPTIRAGDFT